ncbi:hypothetical protein MSZK_28520 [Mycobacterium sp. shizuoka-1]|nr:hypothetical protein MSZK_28520 [Mycobacterium sp. shizuoka-1]
MPWAQVGPGWLLAEWSPVGPHRGGEQPAPGEPEKASTTLYLVDPAGNRYAITTFAPGGDVRLVDWSGDGSHALFTPSYVSPTSAISVDLRTGQQTTIPIAGDPRYTRPDGTALLVSTSFNGDRPGTLKRVDLSGNPQFSYPTDDLGGAGQFSGDFVESADGTRLVLATANLGNEVVARSDNSLVVMSNDGKVIQTLPTPMPKALCAPVKWWTSTTLLVRCTAEGSSANQLWEMPLDGGAATSITALNSGQGDDPGFGGDLGDGDAWRLPSGTFLQSAGACGTEFLSRLTPDGHTARVTIPGVSDSVVVTGAADDRLLVRGQLECGGTTSLVSYDPAANAAKVLLGPPVNGGGVSQAMLYPRPDA